MSNQGIYRITIGHKYYYGQSVNLSKRRINHFFGLKNNKHSNCYMQSAWNKYKDFNFEIVEIIEDVSLLDTREQYYIDLYINDVNCMNLAKFAESTGRGRSPSEETRAKLSASQKDKVLSTEHKAKLFTARAKQIQVTAPDGSVEIFKSGTEAALKLGVHQTSVSAWCTGRNPQPSTGYTFKYLEVR